MRIVERVAETPEVVTLSLVADGAEPIPFEFLPGQFVTIHLDAHGRDVRRAYSISSSPTRRRAIDLTIKLEARGLASPFLVRKLQVGDEIDVEGPFGKFALADEEASAVAFIAGGVGVAPFRSMIRFLFDRGRQGAIDLVYSCRRPEEIVFRKEFEELARAASNFRFHTTITRATPEEWPSRRGRIAREMLESCVPDLARRRCFVCGPGPMVRSVRAMLVELGLPKTSIVVESFGEIVG